MIKSLSESLLPALSIALIITVFFAARAVGAEMEGGAPSSRENQAMFENTGNGIRTHGWLRVEEGRLVSQSGEPVQLRGMSSHGLQWFPQYTNVRAILATKQRGANVFRAAMYADETDNGYNASWQDAERMRNLLYMTVENTLALDMYAIADWHLLKDQTPLRHADSAVAFFQELSSRYAEEPGLIYEICNEPNGETTWDDIYQYAEQVIPAIRANSPNAIIIVGTPRFSSDILALRQRLLPYDNILYSFHMYTGYIGHDFREPLDIMRAENLPIFVSEWGIGSGEDAKKGPLDTTAATEFIAYLKQHQISWVNWSLCNKDEDFSALKSDVNTLSGWSDDDLSVSGAVIFPALSGE